MGTHTNICENNHIRWAKAFGKTSTLPRPSLTRCAFATMHGTSSGHEESMCLLGTTTSSGEVNAARAPANPRHAQPQRTRCRPTTLQCFLEARARAKRAQAGGDGRLCRVERCVSHKSTVYFRLRVSIAVGRKSMHVYLAACVTGAVTTALCLHSWQQQMRGYNRAPFT